MKRRNVLILLISLLTISGCSLGKHIHVWNKFIDFDEDYHYKVCETDKSHIQKEPHNFVLKGNYLDYEEMFEYECSNCKRIKIVSEKETGPFVNEVVDPKYIYKKVSNATTLYYKTDNNGNTGDKTALFLRTILPDEYKEMKYVESRGGNLIDLDLKVQTGDIIETKFECATGEIFGQIDSITPGNPALVRGANGNITYANLAKIDEYKVDDLTVIKLLDVENLKHGKFGLFGAISDNYITRASGRIYSFKYYRNNEAIFDLIPSIRRSDNTVGFYDLVTNKFYAPKKFNDLSGGDVVDEELIDGKYLKTEYTESFGNEYINAGLPFTSETKIDCEVSFGSHGSYNMMFGYYPSELSFSLKNTNEMHCSMCNYETQDLANKKFTRFEKHHIEMSRTEGVTVDNENYTFGPDNYYRGGGKDIYLFATSEWSIDAPYRWGCFGVGKIYSFKIYNGSVLQRDFIPALRVEDEKYGLYDKVENKFYSNDCPRSYFNEGSEVENDNLPEGYTGLTYIETNGTQVIDTGYIFDLNTDSFEIGVRSTATNQEGIIFGTRDFFGYPFYLMHSHSDKNVGIYYVSLNNTISQIRSEFLYDSSSHTYRYDNRCLYVDDNLATEDQDFNYGVGAWYGRLFGSIQATYEPTYCYYGEFYFCKLYSSGKLVRDFVPCRNPQGIQGIFDLVEEKFYTDINSGYYVFEEGKDIEEIVKTNTIKEPTISSGGLDEYTNLYTGEVTYKETDPLAYKVEFSCTNSFVKILNKDDINDFEIKNIAYSINKYTYNYSRSGAIVSFVPVANEGYTIQSIHVIEGDGVVKKGTDDRYYITNLTSDAKIEIIAS